MLCIGTYYAANLAQYTAVIEVQLSKAVRNDQKACREGTALATLDVRRLLGCYDTT